MPCSATSIVVNGGHPVLLAGVVDLRQAAPAALIALDLDSDHMLWQLAANTTVPAFEGQFPLAVTTAGLIVVVPRADAPLIDGFRLL